MIKEVNETQIYLPLICEVSHHGTFDSVVQICISKDYQWRFTSQLQSDMFNTLKLSKIDTHLTRVSADTGVYGYTTRQYSSQIKMGSYIQLHTKANFSFTKHW